MTDKKVIADSVNKWLSRYPIGSQLVQTVENITSTWVELCSPHGTTQQAKILVCTDLTLWLAYIDDLPRHDPQYDNFLSGCLDILKGQRVTVQLRPLLAPYIDLLDTMSRHTSKMHRIIAGREAYIRAIRYRNSLQKTALHPNSTEYLDIRKITIFVHQWMQAFEVTGSFFLTDEQVLSQDLHRALNATVLANIYINEVKSEKKDTADGTTNLVTLRAQTFGISAEVAANQLMQMYRSEADRFHNTATQLRTFTRDIQVERYLDHLESIMAGVDRAYKLISDRYS